MLRRSSLLVVAAVLSVAAAKGREDGSEAHPLHVYEGDDALITCIVRDAGNSTVVWKKEEPDTRRWRVLTAGHDTVNIDRRFNPNQEGAKHEMPEVASTVTIDRRYNVFHDQGGDVWVLAIKDVRVNDSGLYACEVNSSPPTKTFHKLSVLSRALQPPRSTSETSSEEDAGLTKNHNYTDCCIALKVTPSCLGFCNIQSILDGNTGQDPEHCENDFPNIVKCMADGRNHVPCCIDEGVPDICQDVCRGEYTMITDNIKTHFSCSAYTDQTLACIMDGIEILPSRPTDVDVEALTDSSINVEWYEPADNAASVKEYIVNVTMLRSFDPSSVSIAPDTSNSQAIVTPHSVQVSVKVTPNSKTNVDIHDLVPFTMYQVRVTAVNSAGTSLPSDAVRFLTLTPGQQKPTTVAPAPPVPDVKACCRNKGVNHPVCLDKLCDLTQSDLTEVTDFMICAPWAVQTFSCLANSIDHTPCCRARGLPDLCQELCSGNVTTLDFTFFKCVKYMPTYTNCLLQGYGVLPGPPNKLRVTNIATNYAILHWLAPKVLGDTVREYHIHYRLLQDAEYTGIKSAQPPFIMEKLKSDSLYEVFVVGVNTYGVGEASVRVVFSTLSKLLEAKIEESSSPYNVTACCVEAGLSSVCMPLCLYDAKMSDVKALAGVCGREIAKLLRCGAGGRNHGPCCARRGVAALCQPLCAGVIPYSLANTLHACIPYAGNIVQCFDEGTGLLPAPVNAVHAVSISDSEVALVWEPPRDSSNVTEYIIHYKQVDNTSMHETVLKLDNQLNTTDTKITITGLVTGAVYNIFVVSSNQHGTSLPSSILRINASKTDVSVAGVTSPPHSLAVSSHSATYVTISWQPPEFSHAAEQLRYKLFYKAGLEGEFHVIDTTVTSHMLQDLSPNTQHIIYVTAVSKTGESSPSETLIAWTDPSLPAFVETPKVRPVQLVEGRSMTILCIAMGTPMPTVSLYVSGRLVRQEVTRQMVTTVYNLTRDMDQVSCYADNGYGVPKEQRTKIVISHAPHLTASSVTMAAHGDSVTLECMVDAHPEPKMIFWRDYNRRIPVIVGGKYDVAIVPSNSEEDTWMMQLTIKNIKDGDEGDYFCHAENSFGNATQPVSVRIRNVAAVSNVTQCCMTHNVSAECMDACSFYLDFDAVIDRAECINDFDKLMKCAADGSDHRNCCARSGVERNCLDWCRGEPLDDSARSKICLLIYTKKIMSCFREGIDKLPGPPQNVHVDHVDAHTVLIRWDPPQKNKHSVILYRVLWRNMGEKRSLKQTNETSETSLRLTQLVEGATYECEVKAVSKHGASALTAGITFSTVDKYITSETSIGGEEHSPLGLAFCLLLAVAIVAGVVVAAVWFIRTRSLLGHKSNGNVAFENPSYLREVNMDHIQLGQSGDSSAAGGGGGGMAGWKHEPLHVPAASEVPPTLYEELKLGADGAGFKRLKP